MKNFFTPVLLAIAFFTCQSDDPEIRKPEGRDSHVVIPLPDEGALIIAGGNTMGDLLDDAWKWNGEQWQEVSIPNLPLVSGPAWAFNNTANTLVLHGGWSAAGNGTGVTYEIANLTVSNKGNSGPGIRTAHAMVYDSENNLTYLFGGTNNTGFVNDTWSWNGSTWTQITTPGPQARAHHLMAFDPARNRVVLFGGVINNGFLSDTWEFDGTSWTQIDVTGPPSRALHAMEYDPQTGGVVLFGGVTTSDQHQGDTWLWDGSAWSSLAQSGPVARRGHTLTYVEGVGLLLFGGFTGSEELNDLWKWEGSSWTELLPN